MIDSVYSFAQQTTEASDVFSKIVNLGVPSAILFWAIKFAFPSLLDRNDNNQTAAREHFEKILDKIEANRAVAAKDGHDAARKIGEALQDQCEAIRGNTESINHLTDRVSRVNA